MVDYNLMFFSCGKHSFVDKNRDSIVDSGRTSGFH